MRFGKRLLSLVEVGVESESHVEGDRLDKGIERAQKAPAVVAEGLVRDRQHLRQILAICADVPLGRQTYLVMGTPCSETGLDAVGTVVAACE